jgi:NAD-dependent deacetylase
MEIAADLGDALRRARRVVALTGAGVSAESGVPTFRDAQTGLWARFDPKRARDTVGVRA